HGRVSVITNVRDMTADHGGLSRGLLVADYLGSTIPARTHAIELMSSAKGYRPFNLLTFDHDDAYYLGNHPQARAQRVEPGVHGLSNADFNAPWPKTQALVHHLTDWVAADKDSRVDGLFGLLANKGTWPDDVLPDTGIGIERERFLSSAFIVGEAYGTRASTVVLVGHDDSIVIAERRFGPHGAPQGETRYAFPDT
ncbi:MAG: NRDE family protein, partial [Luteibacter sp.]